MLQFEMHFYITKTEDGLIHVQNYIRGIGGGIGQHHVHNEDSFKRWKKDIDPKYLHISKEKTCNCGLKLGYVREYDGHVWFNDRFLKEQTKEQIEKILKKKG